MKHKKRLSKLKMEGKGYENVVMQAEVMNKGFPLVLVREVKREEVTSYEVLLDIKVEVQQVCDLLEYQDERKATGSDTISKWIIEECREQLADKMHRRECAS